MREECVIPEGVACIPYRFSCPITGTCQTSSFTHWLFNFSSDRMLAEALTASTCRIAHIEQFRLTLKENAACFILQNLVTQKT
jgi:hypothetical protein